jgi:hypothetical protein
MSHLARRVCAWCGTAVHRRNRTDDHLIPKWAARFLRHLGLFHDNLEGVVSCCFRCNSEKGSMPPALFLEIRTNGARCGVARKHWDWLAELVSGVRSRSEAAKSGASAEIIEWMTRPVRVAKGRVVAGAVPVLKLRRRTMPTYRKKPIEIEAVQLTGDPKQRDEFEIFAKGAITPAAFTIVKGTAHLEIKTGDGLVKAMPGDFVIRDANGALMPVKPDAFVSTYDPVEPLSAAAR